MCKSDVMSSIPAPCPEYGYLSFCLSLRTCVKNKLPAVEQFTAEATTVGEPRNILHCAVTWWGCTERMQLGNNQVIGKGATLWNVVWFRFGYTRVMNNMGQQRQTQKSKMFTFLAVCALYNTIQNVTKKEKYSHSFPEILLFVWPTPTLKECTL